MPDILRSACCPFAVFMQMCVLGWGTRWHPFWYYAITVYTLNIIWAPYLLRFTEEAIMKQFITRFWSQTVMSTAIISCVIGLTLSGASNAFRAWLPFGDVSLSTLANYFQVCQPKTPTITERLISTRVPLRPHIATQREQCKTYVASNAPPRSNPRGPCHVCQAGDEPQPIPLVAARRPGPLWQAIPPTASPIHASHHSSNDPSARHRKPKIPLG